MKKPIFILILLVVSILPLGKIDGVNASENVQLKVITTCNLYSSPKLNYSDDEESIILQLQIGEILNLIEEKTEGEDCNFSFYKVSITREDVLYEGYVISSFVINNNISSLGRELDSNAKTLNRAQLYVSKNENDKLFINGEEVVLEKYQEIKVIDGYDRGKPFHKIMFKIDGEIYTGYIKTSDLLVKGVNGSLILAVLIFVLVGSVALSIILTTRKKRKKQRRKNLKSTP